MTEAAPPIVAVSACVKQINAHRFHTANQRFIHALTDASRCMPVVMPAVAERVDARGVLDAVSGLVLTGSPSNVHPDYYGDELAAPDIASDLQRDQTTIPVIREAVARGVPIFAVCRGIQELNVALGGTLHQFVHLLPGKRDHRSDRNRPVDQRAALSHDVRVTEGGMLHQILGSEVVAVNSLHGQAIDKPAPGLVIEALSEDGVVEGVSAPDAPGWLLGVQWHPEALYQEDAPSRLLFEAFGEAARAYAAKGARPRMAAE